MKFAFLLLSLAVGSVFSFNTAYACQRDITGGRILCPGDRVVSPSNNTGIVIGVNTYQRKVSVDLDSYSGHSTYDIENVSIGFGCMYAVCVGDRVVSPSNNTGKVIGINPYNKTVSVDLDGYSSHSSYRLEDIFLGFGCVDGVCVRDRVVSPSNNTGQVIGVNPYSGFVSVDLDGYSSHASYNITKIFVTAECLDYGPDYRTRYPWSNLQPNVEFNFYLGRQ